MSKQDMSLQVNHLVIIKKTILHVFWWCCMLNFFKKKKATNNTHTHTICITPYFYQIPIIYEKNL